MEMRHPWTKACACLLALGALAVPAMADHHEAQAAQEAQGAPEMSAEMQAMMAAWEKAGTPGEPHRQLAAMAGKFKATVKMWMGPGEPTVSEADVTREMILDGRVLTERYEGNMMGRPFVGHGMLGYDNAMGKYWSTWNDNMSTGMMSSWGSWDDEKKALVFDGEVSDPMNPGSRMKNRGIARHNADGSETFEMWEPHGPGGEMVRTMEITLVRQ
jgi:hypothetical protein